MKDWAAVNKLYSLEEHLIRRLFEPADARLEVGLEKITAWHVSAVNQNIDNNTHEHLTKLQELLTIRLDVVENVLGNDNARYNYLRSNLANTEFRLTKHRQKGIPADYPAPRGQPTSID